MAVWIKEVNQSEGTIDRVVCILAPMQMVSAYSMTAPEWDSLFTSKGASRNSLPFWLEGLFRSTNNWEKHISPSLLADLKNNFDFSLPTISTVQESADGTVKFLIRFHDQLEVETVLISFHKRYTVCLSTQVGCGMNCSFCYTGTQGLKRNLSAGEIIGQYLVARKWLLEKGPALDPAIVFMGQGEPLHNFEEVRKAIDIFNHHLMIGIGHRLMTLSTVGYLPALKNLENFPSINLALSLHSPFQEERSQLIPINQKYELSEVLDALDKVPLLPRQFITFEYLLIKNFNMEDRHVEKLHELLGHRKAILNLIPFNPFPGSQWQRPDLQDIDDFKKKLVSKKLRVMVRTTKGSDILAACGQLKVNKLARNYEQH